MKALLFAFPGNTALRDALCTRLDLPAGDLELHRFPDEESLVRIATPVDGRDAVLVCSLDRPDRKLVALYLAATALRELGARRVLLLAPYLCYLRQDSRFHSGEAVSARPIARWLSSFVDGLVTVDPHLHRIHDLNQVFSVNSVSVAAAPAIAAWIRAQLPRPLLVGPDSESAQWVEAVARAVPCPCIVLSKQRLGDQQVRVSLPDTAIDRDRQPVLIDDIISTGRTQIAAMQALREAGFGAPICVAVHAVFSNDAEAAIMAAGAARIVTCNTIAHRSNAIDLGAAIATALHDLLPH